ncbi:MAG: transposase [Myxococcota bacterium]
MASYEPRRRGDDVLYQVLDRHLSDFLEQAEESGRGVPVRVRQELNAYLACGIPSEGFVLWRCEHCTGFRVVAFRCKGRGFCPSCGGAQMNRVAAHLVDHVLPEVGVRQWVLTMPYALRFRLAWDIALRRAVHAVLRREVFRYLQRQARFLGVKGPRCGSVTFIQSFASALNLNVHFHMLVLDGAITKVEPNQPPTFVPIAPPRTSDVQDVVDAIAAKVERVLRRRGLLDDDIGEDPDSDDAQRLMMEASVSGRIALGRRAGRRPRMLRGPPRHPGALPNRCARQGGFNLHAGVSVAARDREALERLCRYVGRPPLSYDRLRLRDDGAVEVRLKRPWSDGTHTMVFSGVAFIARLAALIPPKRAHRIVYGGVLAPHSAWRAAIVPGGSDLPTLPDGGDRGCASDHCGEGRSRRRRRLAWAELLWRVFGVDGRECPLCDQVMRLHAILPGWWATDRVLRCLRRTAARGPPQLSP